MCTIIKGGQSWSPASTTLLYAGYIWAKNLIKPSRILSYFWFTIRNNLMAAKVYSTLSNCKAWWSHSTDKGMAQREHLVHSWYNLNSAKLSNAYFSLLFVLPPNEAILKGTNKEITKWPAKCSERIHDKIWTYSFLYRLNIKTQDIHSFTVKIETNYFVSTAWFIGLKNWNMKKRDISKYTVKGYFSAQNDLPPLTFNFRRQDSHKAFLHIMQK